MTQINLNNNELVKLDINNYEDLSLALKYDFLLLLNALVNNHDNDFEDIRTITGRSISFSGRNKWFIKKTSKLIYKPTDFHGISVPNLSKKQIIDFYTFKVNDIICYEHCPKIFSQFKQYTKIVEQYK